MPKGKRKSNAQYATEFDAIRHIFNISFSKSHHKRERWTDKNGKTRYRPVFNRGEKAAITRAFAEFRKYKGADAVPVRRKKSESKKEYRKRIKEIKEQLGQEGTHTNKIFYRRPKNSRTRFTPKGIVTEYTTSTGEFVRETFIKIDPIELLNDTRGYIIDTAAELFSMAKSSYATVSPVFAGNYMGRGFDKDNIYRLGEDELSDNTPEKDTLVYYIGEALNKYVTNKKPKQSDFEPIELIVGFILRDYPRLP